MRLKRLLLLVPLLVVAAGTSIAYAAYKGDLKANTAATVKFCLVDGTDATPETAWDVDQVDIRVTKNGGNFAQKGDATNNAPHDEVGCYDVSLGTGDTDTPGRLEVCMHEAGILRQCDSYAVLTEDFYDIRYVAGDLTDRLDVGMVYKADIDTVTAQNIYDLDTPITSANVWVDQYLTIQDVSTGEVVTRQITAIDEVNDRITVDSAPQFTVNVGDRVRVKDEIHPRAALQNYDPPTEGELTAARDVITANVLAYAQLLARSDAGIKTDQASFYNLLIGDEGSGAGTYDNVTDSLEASQGDLNIITGTNGVFIDDDAITSDKIATAAIDFDEVGPSVTGRFNGATIHETEAGGSNTTFVDAGLSATFGTDDIAGYVVNIIRGGPTDPGANAGYQGVVSAYDSGTNIVTFTPAAPDVVAGGVWYVLGGRGSTVAAVDGHTPQTGDNYIRLGTPTDGDIATDIANVQADVDAARRGLVQRDTTIATYTSNDDFTITTGSPDDNAYNPCNAMITDQVDATQIALGEVLNYTGSTKRVQLSYNPSATFTFAVGDLVTITCGR